MIRYFTFGPDHEHNGVNLRDKYVKVTCPDGDPRTVFMAWLGSNKFGSEYDALSFDEYRRNYAVEEYLSIEISVPCPLCGGRIPSDESRGAYPGALSRRIDIEVCSDCGKREAMEDVMHRG